MKIHIEWQDQFGRWHHYQTKHSERDAYAVASARATHTGKRHRLTNEDGALLDLLEP